MVPSVAELIVASVDNVSVAPHPRQDTGHDTNSSKVMLAAAAAANSCAG